ncbi:hypothetical protein [Pseudomonas nitroreducens]|uniref:Uncharacterized protein n=2 Tax=Pseudomonas nitroreducens TaxID=46680 RepID=A0A6G6J2D9_PSENT|nr:hypothetical protein [Pseudomonas nitroreducens]QIE89230.1 hypothetical protein G5B91_24375 [Pseudomonas nitroreducens]
MSYFYLFFAPYFFFLYSAAYNIFQSLEGMGLASSFTLDVSAGAAMVSAWDVGGAVSVVWAVLFLLCAFVVFPLLLATCYVLGRRKGVLICMAVIIIPGVLSALSLLPVISGLPRGYYIGGAGSLGSAFGFIPIAIIGVVVGWCLVILIYDSFRLSDRFRHAYDHVWFMAAILTGVFFVADSGTSQDYEKHNYEVDSVRGASSYLLGQVKSLRAHCIATGDLQSLSCRWASNVQQKLNDYSALAVGNFVLDGPRVSADIYSVGFKGLSDGEIVQMRKEIDDYNLALCPVVRLSESVTRHSSPSDVCQIIPPPYCRAFPDAPDGLVDRYIIGRPVAIASECVVPTLVALRNSLERQSAVIAADKSSKHYRWLFFVALSIALGGKVANSTTRMIDMDRRPNEDRRRILDVLRFLAGLASKLVRLLLNLSRGLIRSVRTLWSRAA